MCRIYVVIFYTVYMIPCNIPYVCSAPVLHSPPATLVLRHVWTQLLDLQRRPALDAVDGPLRNPINHRCWGWLKPNINHGINQ